MIRVTNNSGYSKSLKSINTLPSDSKGHCQINSQVKILFYVYTAYINKFTFPWLTSVRMYIASVTTSYLGLNHVHSLIPNMFQSSGNVNFFGSCRQIAILNESTQAPQLAFKYFKMVCNRISSAFVLTLYRAHINTQGAGLLTAAPWCNTT